MGSPEAVSGKQLTLGRREAGGVEAFHPADDQPPRDVLIGAFAGERGEGDFGDLGVGNPPLLDFLPDSVRIPDGDPGVVADAGNGLAQWDSCVR